MYTHTPLRASEIISTVISIKSPAFCRGVMARCSYIFKRANKDYKENEQCRVYPKDGGEWCAKHCKKKTLTKEPVVDPVPLPPSPPIELPRLLGKRRSSMFSSAESDMSAPPTKKNVIDFARGEHFDRLREYYANKAPEDTDKLLPIIGDDADNLENPKTIVMVDKYGRETELEDDGIGEDLDEVPLDTDEEEEAEEENEEKQDKEDPNPFHPLVIAEIGAIHCLQVIESVGKVPGYTDAVVSIPQWRIALRRVLRERLKDLDAIPAEWVLAGITLMVFTRMKYAPTTKHHDAEPDTDSNGEPGEGEELPANSS